MPQDTLTTHIKITEQVNAIKANDDNTLKTLYQNNYSKIEQYVINNNGSAQQAKDVYQEAFIALWRNIQLDKFKPQNSSALEGYLYQVAKNKWLDHLRSSHYKKVVPIDDNSNGVQQPELLSAEENEYIVAIKNNFKQLGDNCKEVLTRFYYKKQPLKTIAAAFNWTEATARNNKYRCLQRLRELLKK